MFNLKNHRIGNEFPSSRFNNYNILPHLLHLAISSFFSFFLPPSPPPFYSTLKKIPDILSFCP